MWQRLEAGLRRLAVAGHQMHAPRLFFSVTSELVTNAITHGEGAVLVDLTYGKGRIRIEVTDQGDAPVIEKRKHDPAVTRGRGLQIVDALSRRWGTFRVLGSGNTVWADVRVLRRRWIATQ